jgi:hypothetical protein
MVIALNGGEPGLSYPGSPHDVLVIFYAILFLQKINKPGGIGWLSIYT